MHREPHARGVHAQDGDHAVVRRVVQKLASAGVRDVGLVGAVDLGAAGAIGADKAVGGGNGERILVFGCRWVRKDADEGSVVIVMVDGARR